MIKLFRFLLVVALAFIAGCGAGENFDRAEVVYDRMTGMTLRSVNADAQFRTASLVKLLIAIDLVQRGIVTPENPSPRMARMLSHSDDTMADLLWTEEGGPHIVTRTASKLGLKGTKPPATPGRWGDTEITANDVVKIYQYILILGLPAEQRNLLLDPLRNAPRIAGDGTNQYFGIPSALPRPWAIKQGWAAGRGGIDAHTSGLVGEGDRYILVVLTHYPEGGDLATAEQNVTRETSDLASLLT